jgi:hypothetical protein
MTAIDTTELRRQLDELLDRCKSAPDNAAGVIDDDVVLAALHAVDERRTRSVDERAVDELTDRDRALIEAAYAVGAGETRDRVTRTVGPAAVTVDAQQLIGALNARPWLPHFRRPAGPPFYEHPTLIAIVARARGIVESQVQR